MIIISGIEYKNGGGFLICTVETTNKKNSVVKIPIELPVLERISAYLGKVSSPAQLMNEISEED